MALTFIAIVLLAAAWAALLLPDLRRRGSSRRSNSIATFNRQLSTIVRARAFLTLLSRRQKGAWGEMTRQGYVQAPPAVGPAAEPRPLRRAA